MVGRRLATSGYGGVFPPGRATLQGRARIIAYFQGGLSNVDVRFSPVEVVWRGEMAFETGVFRDLAKGTAQVVAEGNYAITWIHAAGAWQILCHTWSPPIT
jgi:hypothetical protein